jgi:ribosomal protein L37AE/L43A
MKNRLQMKKFIKNTEDFKCQKCGEEVIGSGYTNHCPNCLWSKHVDVNPGDREEECQGLMRPVGYQKLGDKERVVHQCQKCGQEKTNKLSPQDKREVIYELLSTGN